MAIKPLAAALAVGIALGARGEDLPREAPAALAAPALPFRYIGRVVQNGKAEVLVVRGAMVYSLAEGDEIDGEYRVERITGAAIRFTYLPAGSKHELDLSGAKR